MKQAIVMKYRKIATIIAFLSLCPGLIEAQEYTETRRISKEFDCSKSTTIEVSNKYGRVHVMPWDKDSVKFDIVLNIKTNSIPRLKKLRDNVDFDFTATAYFINATTVFNNNKYNSFFSDLKTITESLLPTENEVVIDYTIKVPAEVILNLSNKYGDIYMDDLNGEVSIALSNGDLKANKLMGKSYIGIAFGDVNINYLNEGKIEASYADVRVRDAKNIIVESKSSNINVDNAKMLKINSKRDKFVIGEADNILGETYFTDIQAQQLNKDLNLNLKYGELYLQNVIKGFSLININSEYTDIEIFLQRGTSYQLDITHTPDVYLRLPSENADINEKIVNDETKEMMTFGKIGTAETASKIKLSAMKKCNISIMQK
ncbi:MAG: hypothetical protein JXB49_12300 [Bacteroidales bacterium]|nr:hypothetical protein [Bacteroidales bacterium]